MNIIKKIKTIIGGIGLAAVLSTGIIGAIATPAMAHETDCPYCKLKVVQDTKEQDNEVVLAYGNKKIEYRCVMCAVADAKTKYKSRDLTILAPSTIKGKKVTITKKGDAWTASPATAVFVYNKGNHDKCQELYRAAIDNDAAMAWMTKKGLKEAKHLSLKDMVEASK